MWLRKTSPVKPILIPFYCFASSDLWLVSWCLASGAQWETPPYSLAGDHQVIFHLKVPLLTDELMNAYRHDQRMRELIAAYQECKRVLVEAKQARGAT